MSATDKLSSALTQLAKVKVADKASNTALSAGKQLVRDAKAELEAPTSPPAPPPPVPVESRPWLRPVETDAVLGAVGQVTKLKDGQTIEHAELRGEIHIEDGGEVWLKDCRHLGEVGRGDGGTGIRVSNGHLFTTRCEFAGAEGRSGFYLTDSGVWTPVDTWIHDNGKGGGKMHQQVYVAGGSILAGQRVLIENGEDNGLQLYSPKDYTSPVHMVEIDDLETRGCPNNAGLMVSHRVEALAITNLRSHDNAIGVYGYETEGAATPRKIGGRAWNNKTNVRNAEKLNLALVEAAP